MSYPTASAGSREAYLEVAQGEAYLSLMTDAYSRKIVGYIVSMALSVR